MANAYKTPGVYVEEISTLPASVAQVATAIPAFIGYTEKAEKLNGDPITGPHRITSLLEYESLFGGPEPETTITVAVSEDDDGKRTVKAIEPSAKSIFLMYYGMKMYFMNGGGPCYIVSVGNYKDEDGNTITISDSDLEGGLISLEKEDEPTLIVFPDGPNIARESSYYTLQSASLAQCNKLKDRFSIIDLHMSGDDPAEKFRNSLSSDYLKYGAAYYPNLKTTIGYFYKDGDVMVDFPDSQTETIYTLAQSDIDNWPSDSDDSDTGLSGNQKTELAAAIAGKEYATEEDFKGAFPSSIMKDTKIAALVTAAETTRTVADKSLDNIKDENNELYNLISVELDQLFITLPPSSTMAGVYARVDNDRGVWKAPANVTLTGVIEPSEKITHEAQENLNIDPTSGKSINAIRAFTGKGVLVWGARTLAGNDNEWRYIPVRRLFNMVEESVKKATEFVVFEPNDANTWVRVKAMIENYLTGLWRAGALAGAKTDQAFFVNVGLGTTMTAQDILEGRMIIEIGMAAVRPAEFIIIRFSHKLQES